MKRSQHHAPNYANGDFDLSYHMEMLSDHERVDRCMRAIDYHVGEDSVFCELGCGTGIFSIYAARKCRKVYAVELDERVLEVAINGAERAGVLDKIEFVHQDARTVRLDEKVDVVFAEMMSIWLITEPQVLVMNNAREHMLKPGGKMIPMSVSNLVELGNYDYRFGDIEIHAPLPQFTGIRPPRIVTESRIVNAIDFYTPVPERMRSAINLRALYDETINCARISSLVQFAPGVNFYSTDSLMPVTIIPLEREVAVRNESVISLEVEYDHRSALSDARFSARLIS